jgi:hypothetical protein
MQLMCLLEKSNQLRRSYLESREFKPRVELPIPRRSGGVFYSSKEAKEQCLAVKQRARTAFRETGRVCHG